MENKEQLLEQQVEWTVKYREADKRIRELLPGLSGSSKRKELKEWVPTKESLAAFEKAQRDINRALVKLRRIGEKLYKLR